jgi:hypothetical protein
MIRCTSAKVRVPVSLLWHVRHVRPLPPNVSFSKSFFPVELDTKLILTKRV